MRNCLLNHPTADGSCMCSSRLLEDYLLPFGHGLAHLSCDRVPQPARFAQLPILENEMTDRAVRGRDMIEAVLHPRRLATGFGIVHRAAGDQPHDELDRF